MIEVKNKNESHKELNIYHVDKRMNSPNSLGHMTNTFSCQMTLADWKLKNRALITYESVNADYIGAG